VCCLHLCYPEYNLLIALISKGNEAPKEECPIFVAASHSTFFDAFVIPYLGMPIVLSREENKSIPFMGKKGHFTIPFRMKKSYLIPGRLLILGQCIFLKREDLQSKQLAAKGITDWLENTSR